METLNNIKLDIIELRNEQMEGLPLFFKKIFFNQVTNLEDELKLYKYNTASQSAEMRSYYPNRIICKTHNPEIAENEVYKK
jgi:hypothetical protein